MTTAVETTTLTVYRLGVAFRIEVAPDRYATLAAFEPGTFTPAEQLTWRDTWDFMYARLYPLFDGQPVLAALVEREAIPLGRADRPALEAERFITRCEEDGMFDEALRRALSIAYQCVGAAKCQVGAGPVG